MEQEGDRMSYIIPGDIPNNCGECPCGYITEGAFSDECRVLAREWEKDADSVRPNWCPLIEIPIPHGRLIDKAKLKRELFVNFMGERIPFYDCDNFPTTLTYIDLHSILSEQPTVIEAED